MEYYEEQKMDQWFFRAALALGPVIVLICFFTLLVMGEGNSLAVQHP